MIFSLATPIPLYNFLQWCTKKRKSINEKNQNLIFLSDLKFVCAYVSDDLKKKNRRKPNKISNIFFLKKKDIMS